jgi:hypothetical protein
MKVRHMVLDASFHIHTNDNIRTIIPKNRLNSGMAKSCSFN